MKPLEVQASTACFPGHGFLEAARRLRTGVSEPLLGRLGMQHCQLCPQNFGIVDEKLAGLLKERFPATRFRLHANVRVFQRVYRFSAADFNCHTAFYFERLAEVSSALGAPAYSLHAGRSVCSLEDLRRKVAAIEEMFDIPVAIEGHYPTSGWPWLLSGWDDYRWLFDSGLRYALDLSHLNILAARSGRREADLVVRLLSSPRCLEIHVSGNDGRRDLHRPLLEAPWWWLLLEHRNPDAVVFSEGNRLAHRREA